MSCNCTEPTRKPLDSDPHGYITMNPLVGAPARATLSYPFRCAVDLVASYGLNASGTTFRKGTFSQLSAGQLAQQVVSGTITLDAGQVLNLTATAAVDFALATFKITKL